MLRVDLQEVNEFKLIKISFFMLLVSFIGFFLAPIFYDNKSINLYIKLYASIPVIGGAFASAAIIFSFVKIRNSRWFISIFNITASVLLAVVFAAFLYTLVNAI